MEVTTLAAQHFWHKTFGHSEYEQDFAGRFIDYNEYNNYKSKYGWSIEPIMPEKLGGKNRSSNYVICHFDTAAEKANHFPAFMANGTYFEVVYDGKNHIIRKSNAKKKRIDRNEDAPEDMYDVDFQKGSSGVKFIKGLKGIQNQPRFAGIILVRIRNMKTTAVVDFLEKYFETENVTFYIERNFAYSETQVVARDYNLPYKEDTQELLDKCVILNTYMQKYFMPQGLVEAYDIFYRCEYYLEKAELYMQCQGINLDGFLQTIGSRNELHNGLFVCKNVLLNTSAGATTKASETDEFTAYDGIVSSLAKELEKL